MCQTSANCVNSPITMVYFRKIEAQADSCSAGCSDPGSDPKYILVSEGALLENS